MGSRAYERLSAQDSSYIKFESSGPPVHVTAVAIFDSGPLRRSEGGIDVERVRRHIAARLHLLPHYRQRLAFTPVQSHPIWVDDHDFDLAYHVRHTALPSPGSESQLKELASRLAAQPLDRNHPLWELWFVEGLEGERFGVVAKVHHSMIDGVTGVGVLTALLSPSRDVEIEEPRPWTPRPVPGTLTFLADGVADGARFSVDLLKTAADSVLSPRETGARLLDGVGAAWQTLRAGFTPPADLPINRPVGRQRHIEWHALDLHGVRDLRKRLDGSLNDVVLSVVAGSVRRLLRQRRVKLKGMDLRVIVPVDRRVGPVDMHVGNRVSAWFLSMPVGESSALRRFEKIRTQTRALKRSDAARGIDGFLRFADWTGSTRLTFWGVNLAAAVRPYNLIVTNVHGPQFPLYLLGAELREFVPVLPLFSGQGLAVAVMSYRGRVSFGLVGDQGLASDIADLPGFVDEAFEELRDAASARR